MLHRELEYSLIMRICQYSNWAMNPMSMQNAITELKFRVTSVKVENAFGVLACGSDWQQNLSSDSRAVVG